MREYIGLRLAEAIKLIEQSGGRYTIDSCDSDKLKKWDDVIVVKATKENDSVKLITARFLMNLEGDNE